MGVKLPKGVVHEWGGVMALTPGAGSNNGMGLRSRRKWDKWAQWMVTSECQAACGGWDS